MRVGAARVSAGGNFLTRDVPANVCIGLSGQSPYLEFINIENVIHPRTGRMKLRSVKLD